MANRREDEKNERTIRNLLKLPDNRRCINCNSLGPQYVCTNFWTFVCTTCSGLHREFTHRVKSVSMAKFTSQEVSALQGGGNASAKEIYLKDWDPQRNSLPDGSNVERLRDFIKHVYVDRRYSGERNFEKPPRGKMAEAENLNENRKTDTYQGGSRSPPNEEVYERRYSDRPSPGGRSSGGRSPGFDQKSPARAEVINDWRREDRFGNGRRSDDGRISDGGSKFESLSPDRQSDLDTSSPPMVRPVREILGDSVSPLRVIEPPKTNGGRSAADSSMRTQRTASSSSLASSNGNPVELKKETSLIDFDDVPEPPASAPAPQIQQSATVIPVAQPTKPAADNWANFDSFAEVKASPAPSNTNLLDVLSELAAPATATAPSGSPGGSAAPFTPFSSFAPGAATMDNSAAFPLGGALAAPTGPTSILPVSGGNAFANTSGRHWSNMQPQQTSLFPTTGPQAIPQLSTPAAGGPSGNQQWNSSVAPSTLGYPSSATAQVPQAVNLVLQEATSAVASQASSVEIKSIGRKELPADLFAVNYSSIPGAYPGWHTGPHHGYGYAVQYNMSMATNALPQPSKSTNPFDAINEPPVQAPTFPSMASLQGALPNMAAPTGLVRTSSLGAPTFHPPAMPQQAPSYASPIPQGSYMGHQVAGSMPQRPPGVASFGFDGFGALNSNQQQGGLYSAPPPTQNTFSSPAGNPFG
ncbi:probable ADP-ribosylation factor GTPase-activating protein AGD14 isoform X1 [Lycium ferocissimum]|uniref:probable ADP-ribosylation factor GTPase-activating protein AGD14 isoform X1 n=1 Tax=Lycium ferocissimum TaxID=112874 RepID=UPI0028158144|nr:probable ADP-ribosylation factor GTPase-activating protein AGD14 isoform X1 [Lycium ferocissimum]XP_059276839.1 probable ADP-ribosylation factor GTPase-activating protein AGD14 isoform X1 [Lycium ferocissimum]